MAEKRFLLDFNIPMAPGDILMVTALVRDLALTYGDRYEVGVASPYMDSIWRHNPYIKPLAASAKGVHHLPMSYLEELKASQRGLRLHYVTAFHRVFQRLTGIHVPVRQPKGDLHLTDEEKATPRISGRYWVIVPGGKQDMTIKYWNLHKYQAVVDRLRPWGLRFVQEGAIKPMHEHPPLRNVLNLVGLTTQRDMMVNIYHAEGVICGVSYPMHLAAALDKPCVVLAGGREEPWWEWYGRNATFGDHCPPVKVPHEFLHTVGQLSCCTSHGCWRRRVVPLHDNRPLYDNDLCQQPVFGPSAVAKCMDVIQTSHAVEAIMRYYERGQLPPPASSFMQAIQPPTGAYDRPPTGATPAVCPRCGSSLEHFLIRSGESPVVVPPEPQLTQATEMIAAGSNKAPAPSTVAARPLPVDVVPTVHPAAQRLTGMDHAKIGGKMTICVLLHGNEQHYHRQCLSSILATVPPSRMDLRIALNQVCPSTKEYLQTLPVSKVYDDDGTRRKYPAMRQLFWDPELPITTPWLCWFDDDTQVRPEAADWLSLLTDEIIACDDPCLGMLGDPRYHPLQIVPAKDPRPWFTTASWHRGKLWRTTRGTPVPNGTAIHFCVGWFWCLKTEAMRACNIPDTRLNHNGGDIVVGEQLYQGSYTMRPFNQNKKYITTPPNGRRGFHEQFPFYA